jgi:hypothetical protein
MAVMIALNPGLAPKRTTELRETLLSGDKRVSLSSNPRRTTFTGSMHPETMNDAFRQYEATRSTEYQVRPDSQYPPQNPSGYPYAQSQQPYPPYNSQQQPPAYPPYSQPYNQHNSNPYNSKQPPYQPYNQPYNQPYSQPYNQPYSQPYNNNQYNIHNTPQQPYPSFNQPYPPFNSQQPPQPNESKEALNPPIEVCIS